MSDEDVRIIPAIKGSVQCLPGKKEPLGHCGLCIHCREFRIKGSFVKSPSLAYCTKCRVTDKVDLANRLKRYAALIVREKASTASPASLDNFLRFTIT